MKKLTIMTLLLFVSRVVYSQSDLPNVPLKGKANTSTEEVIKLDPRMSAFDFVPGQILAKFKDDTPVKLGKTSTGKVVVGIESVDQVLSKYQLRKAERLFPNEQRIFNKRLFKTYNGNEIEESSLHNIYKLEFDSTTNVMGIIEELKQNNNVVYAEPNYIFSIVESKPVSPELSETEMIEWLKEHPEINLLNKLAEPQSPKVVTPNDPFYGQQYYINAVQADSVWKQTTGDTTQVIAILDTGVDWLHPDLKNKIWININEIPDNGIDDDGDGYVDDVRGWDFVNFDNNPRDDNAHGTHVAGIAAAEGNNNLGIAGVSWGAKILPIKVLNNNGYGDVSNIAQGVNYAANKKANIINMSLGYYWRSMTVESALVNALLNNCVLVAAAGNDKLSIYDVTSDGPKAMYPAALSYVLGVQSTDGRYSNYDPDGPIYSKAEEGLNYELVAPGSGIISCVPGGNYRVFSGTSMAAPIVSGSIALYKTVKNDVNNEEMWGDLIHSSQVFNINSAIFKTTERKPKLDLVNFTISDTLAGDDKDNQVDAGEEIELWVTVRNTFGKADSVFCEIELDPVSKPYYSDEITFTSPISFVGSMAAYAKRTNQSNPFRLKFHSTFPNEANLELRIKMWDNVAKDTFYQTINVRVFNGTELSGIINNDITLTPDRLWIINNSLRLGTGYKMTILPGTHIINNATFDNRGTVEAIGTPDSLITIEGSFNVTTGKYIRFELKGQDFNGGIFEKCWFYSGNNFSGTRFFDCDFIAGNRFNNGTIEKSRIDGFGKQHDWQSFIKSSALINCDIKNSVVLFDHSNLFKFNNFYNTIIYSHGGSFPDGAIYEYNNFIKFKNIYVYTYPSVPQLWTGTNEFYISDTTTRFENNTFLMEPEMKMVNLFTASGTTDQIDLSNIYWGTNQKQKIDKFNVDFYDNAGLPIFNYEPMLIAPPDSCHGIVWKVLVNGKDAQDEVVDPLGVATHRFDVYFNRAMDKNYPPQITFGVREPYTQQSVSLNGSWSADGKIYTAYKKVELYTGDGINRVRVTGARDLEDFEIPVEDMRFEFLIDAAGSASTDFLATAGIGKVKLEWPAPSELPTLLGYNIYRFTNLTDTTFTDPVQINDQLVTDTTYIDYKVEPHKKYYYKYKVVRTDFTESDYSKVVNATVLTAAKGDANGDLTITVQDIVSIVSYILNQNPQPFLAEAADVNSDSKVDILDIVGIINKIMNPGPGKIIAAKPKVRFDKEGVYVENGEGVAGIEIKIVGEGIEKAQVISGEMAKGMELAYKMNKDTLTVLMFSFKNETMQGNGGLLLKLSEGKIKKLYNMKASDMRGNEVEIEYSKDDLVIPSGFVLYQNYPNPFNPTTTIKYGLPEKRNVEVIIYNILGQKIKMWSLSDQSAGYHELLWNSTNDNNQIVSSGIYIYQIRAGNYINQKKMLLIK